MKQLLLNTTILLIMLSMVSLNASAYDLEVNGIYYNITSSVQRTVEVTSGSAYSGSVVIPKNVSYDGVTYSVTSIGAWAFYGSSGLAFVEIPNSVTTIGACAFMGCTGLNSINLPNSLETIGRNAFAGCSGLASPLYNSTLFAYMPTSYQGFYSIPKGIKKICDSAFAYCEELTGIEISNSVTTIGSNAFYGCSGLSSVTIPASVTQIGSWLFSECSSLLSISVDGDNAIYDSRGNCNAIIETASNSLIAGCNYTTIPNSVTSIGTAALAGLNNLSSIDIPNNVNSIGDEAFCGCSALASIEIPNSVTTIGEYNQEIKGETNVEIIPLSA